MQQDGKDSLQKIGDALRGFVVRGEVAGAVALVARGDTVQVEAAGVQDFATGTPMRRDTIFRIASMTKPITAAAAMLLVEEGKIGLADPVERWLPELATPRVLRAIDSKMDDTEPARRPITLDDLLTMRLGIGAVMAPPKQYPIQAAMEELGVAPGPALLPFTPDEYLARLARLPLIHQPGERWMYHIGAEVLAVLIARVARQPLENFLRERIFSPLDMADTGFSVPERSLDRFAACYDRDAAGRLQVWDSARGGQYSAPPPFPSELVSTADDFCSFARMLLNQGRHNGKTLLAPDSVRLMLTDHITPAQKAASPFFPGFWERNGWGFGGAVTTRGGGTPGLGSYGWAGGCGTRFVADPRAGMVVIALTQRLMRGPDDAAIVAAVETLAYQAIAA